MRLADYPCTKTKDGSMSIRWIKARPSLSERILAHLSAICKGLLSFCRQPANKPHVLTVEEWQERQWWTKALHYTGALLTSLLIWVIIIAFVWEMAFLAEVSK